jgi:hypothetical protein
MVIQNKLLGFSTKCFSRTGWGLSKKVQFCSKLGTNIIEIDLTTDNISMMDDKYLHEELREFENVYVHLPHLGTSPRADYLINRLKDVSEKVDLNGVIVQPHRVSSFEQFANSGLPILISNTDDRKNKFRYPHEFKQVLGDYLDFGLALNLNHCYTNDRTLYSAKEFVEFYGPRIQLVHLSGYGVNDTHLPLNNFHGREKVSVFFKNNDLNSSAIMQGIIPFEPKDNASQELWYVKQILEIED